jgi:hypothetical protein
MYTVHASHLYLTPRQKNPPPSISPMPTDSCSYARLLAVEAFPKRPLLPGGATVNSGPRTRDAPRVPAHREIV